MKHFLTEILDPKKHHLIPTCFYFIDKEHAKQLAKYYCKPVSATHYNVYKFVDCDFNLNVETEHSGIEAGVIFIPYSFNAPADHEIEFYKPKVLKFITSRLKEIKKIEESLKNEHKLMLDV